MEHLVRFVLSGMKQGQQWLRRMDFSTLEPLPTETIDAWLQAGYQDIAWRLKVRAAAPGAPEWLRVLILVEFQSKVEHDMALRVQGYMQRMHEQAWKERHVRETDRLPPRARGGVLQRGQPVASKALSVGPDREEGAAGAGPRGGAHACRHALRVG